MKIIHLTDTHLVQAGEKLFELDPEQRLKDCIRDINRHHPDTDLCIITGDLADKGEYEAYIILRECLNDLKIPWQLVIGNHDCRETFLKVFPEVTTDGNGYIQQARQTPEGVMLFLDTKEDGTHQGHYCRTRRKWLRQQLEEADNQAVYLFMHHPPFKVGLPAMDQISLQEADKFIEVTKSFTPVRHIFFGHLHRPVSGNWCGIPFTTLRGTNHQVTFDMKTVDLLKSSHEPPAYAVALIEGDSMVVHFHDYMDLSPRFDAGSPSR